MTDRPVTPFAAFAPPPKPDTVPPLAETHIPGPPRLPAEARADPTMQAPDPLVELGDRVASLSDALHDPKGVAALRHNSIMAALGNLMKVATDIADEQVKINDRLNRLEPTVADHTAALHLVKGRGNGNGNGADHA